MNQELAFRDALLVDALSHELRGQFCAFALSHHPADHKTTEQVEDDLEIKVGPLERAAQLGDVPSPHLVGLRGQQFRLAINRMSELVTTLAHLAVLLEQAVPGARRTNVAPLIQQGGMHLVRRLVEESLRMQNFECGLTLGVGERSRRLGPGRNGIRGRARRSGAVKRGPWNSESTTGRSATSRGREFEGRCPELLPS